MLTLWSIRANRPVVDQALDVCHRPTGDATRVPEEVATELRLRHQGTRTVVYADGRRETRNERIG